jgi:hypothetical protein
MTGRPVPFDFDPNDLDQFAWLGQIEMWHYVRGYEEAARILVEATETPEARAMARSDRLALPVVFLCRQAVELRMKDLIATGNRCLGTTEPIEESSHNLSKLWTSCRRLIMTAWPGTPDEDLDGIDSVIAGLHVVDPASTAFRYPTDRKGNKSLPDEMESFNLRVFFNKVTTVIDALEAAETGIDAEHDMRVEYEAELSQQYEEAMREEYGADYPG